MKSQHKQKTAPIPHRIMNKTSIYLAKQYRVEREDFLGYEAVVQLEDGQSIAVRSTVELTPKDGRIFEYVLSQWHATKSLQKDLQELKLDISLIIKALGQKNRTENRKKVIQHIKNIATANVVYTWNGGEIIFHMLETVKIIDGTNTVSIKVSDTYYDAMNIAGERYINVSKVMELKSAYAIELAKFLQTKGSGVSGSGEPKPPKEINHMDICNFLHLNRITKRADDEIRRAFKALMQVGYPEYKYNGHMGIWKKQEILKPLDLSEKGKYND